MKKKISLVVLTTAMSMMLLTACTGNNESANGTTQPVNGNGSTKVKTLRFATWDTGDALKIEQDIAKKFETNHPGTKIQVEAYADGFDQKLAAGFGATNPPDVMYMWDFPTYHQSLEPLNSYADGDKDLNKDDFYSGLFNYATIENSLYGIPAGFTTRVVYYNKKMFDDSKIPYPKDGWTWDDFQDISKQLTDKAKKQYGFGVRAENDTYDLQGFVWSNGSSLISDDGKTINGYMNSSETASAIQMFGDMVKNGSAVLAGGKGQQSGEDIFKGGKIAMWESGIWPLESFKQAGIDVGVVEMPAFPGKPVKGVVAESALSIAKDSKNKDLAWEFIKYYVSNEAIKMRVADLPVRVSVVKELKKDQDPLYKPFYTMLQRSDNTPAFLLNTKWNEINRQLSAAVESVVHGGNAQDTLNQTVKESERYLK
ncbi:ABC transporter substrate-binding protein [Paenibacillus macquariensis]|uniref:Multiple sugar transport system substrate-binding protein n=1 Tax=Paenibacillus macquariensis TaxID=948756 RepID=A0ABY1K816_9BACL|nr:sugar ABC transporter substrate-binding protein [Paenibacillus macquariensis]MEC0091194.1 sugar ABC transporter substrate-binding protein [Paenibacillus macquariensis]OAB33627.1 sugar ABC transporter substrate-binding protein [Paenibacillus macquariensis subsp. macquariensis]SIR38904.1 multiple sugar transport system substrate-binding protein [Paenibacillus macquariensis]